MPKPGQAAILNRNPEQYVRLTTSMTMMVGDVVMIVAGTIQHDSAPSSQNLSPKIESRKPIRALPSLLALGRNS